MKFRQEKEMRKREINFWGDSKIKMSLKLKNVFLHIHKNTLKIGAKARKLKFSQLNSWKDLCQEA